MKRYLLILITGLLHISSLACVSQVFEVEKYGEDYDAFARLCDDVNKNRGGHVVFPKNKIYTLEINNDYHGGHRSLPQDSSVLLKFKGCNTIDVDLNGCTLVVAPNHSTKYAVALFFDCKSFRLYDGCLIGDAIGHDYSPVVYKRKLEKSTHEWGYGILVLGSRGTIENVTLLNMTGDGIYVGGYHTSDGNLHSRLSINSCDISYCRRNGVSCASVIGFNMHDTRIHHIGTSSKIVGTPPESGLDLEYEDGVADKGDVIIRDCRITDCAQKVISASNSSPPVLDNFVIEGCYFEGASFQVCHVKKAKTKTIRNCTVVHCPIHFGDAVVDDTSFDLGHGVHYVSGGHFRRCDFVGSLEESKSNYGCTLAGTNLNETIFEDCSFINIRAANNTSPTYQGFAGYHFPLRVIFKRCTLSNCSFVRGNVKYASSFVFYDSKLLDGCMIYNLNNDIPVKFERCELIDLSGYQTQTGLFSFKKSTLVQKNKSMTQPLLLYGNNSFDRCTIVDEVGFPYISAKKHGIKSYRLEASRSIISFHSDSIKTEGMSLRKGVIHGISKDSFMGSLCSVKFE